MYVDMTCGGKTRKTKLLVQKVGSEAAAAVKMNWCRAGQIKSVQVMKCIIRSHLYIQQTHGWTDVFTG